MVDIPSRKKTVGTAMKKRLRCVICAAILTLTCMPAAHAANIQYQELRAGNAHELIADMFIAAYSGQPTRIRLARGHYVFESAFGTAYDGSYLPVVTGTLDIIGSDASKTVLESDLSADLHRFFVVARGARLTLEKITLSGGSEICQSNDCRNEGGGAVLNTGGTLEFHDCVLSDNNAYGQEGQEIAGGGAIFNLKGALLLDRTRVTNNGAELSGGAIYLRAGNGTISNSIISGNFVRFAAFGRFAAGAAIYVNSGASLKVAGTTISDNAGDSVADAVVSGFGIYNSGKLTLINSAVVDNLDENTGDAEGTDAGAGGGIFNNGEAELVNTTVAGNSVGTLGGGIYNAGTLVLRGTTITDNTVYDSHAFRSPNSGFPDGCTPMTQELCVAGGAGIWNEPTGIVSIATSVIGANQGEDCNGVLTTFGHNALGSSANCTLKRSVWLGPHASYDLLNLDVRLRERQDNGAPGNAHYTPLPDSRLIDAGGPVGPNCTALDQIGQRRVEGDADHNGAWKCDIGAIEYLPAHHP